MKLDCYEIGKRFGKCGAQILYNLPYDEKDNEPIPIECRNNEETNRGITDGVEEIHNLLNIKIKGAVQWNPCQKLILKNWKS